MGDSVSCDFCNIDLPIDELISVGSGYMSCTTCADDVFGDDVFGDNTFSQQYTKPSLILPGDVVKHKAGGQCEYDVVSVDGGHQLFMSYVDGNGKLLDFDNGGYGYDPVHFEIVRRVG
jgi:hypothetical protein